MLSHHIQRSIVKKLVYADALRFSDLKPDDIDNKLFTYHLKLVVGSGMVEKLGSGEYQLTDKGRRSALSAVNYSNSDRSGLAYSLIFLLVRRAEDGAYLLYRRKTHPLKERTALMHSRPSNSIEVLEHASAVLSDKTNLSGSFRFKGAGYFHFFKGEELESFTHYILLVCEDAEGELNASDERADYYWDLDPDFDAPEMLPNMPGLINRYKQGGLFFYEDTFHIDR